MAVKSYNVTFITGDGTGPELSEVTKRCLEATGVKFNWDIQTAGLDVMEKEGTPLPQRVLDSLHRNRVGIKAPLTTPIGTGFRSVNVALRKEMDLYACVRPCKTYPGVHTRYAHVDLVLIRENTEDLYAGIEFKEGASETKELMEAIERLSGGRKIRPDSGISIKPISISGTERIVTYAFEYARKYHRKRVTAVTKANIMKFTDGLFYEVAREVAKKYPDIQYDECLVDNMCMQLVTGPQRYDVLVLPNLYGDIISDLCAGLVGGLGVAPGGNIGVKTALFEATHGSAPKYKGLNKVNPTAMILSGVMMLHYLGEEEAANQLEEAVSSVIQEGKNVTYDLKPDRGADGEAVGTREMGEAIIQKLKEIQNSTKKLR
jgi:isocitrate dehydrogenase (NAD+)